MSRRPSGLPALELTTLEAFDGYWVPLGWSKEAPILTQSRIDTPHGGVSAGQVHIGGIAWAPDRGISRVEVSIDGTWGDARLSRPISNATWVQWVTDWAATPGRPRHPGPRDRRHRCRPAGAADAACPGRARAAGTPSTCRSADATRRHRSKALRSGPDPVLAPRPGSSASRNSPYSIAASTGMTATESSVPRSRYNARSWTSRSKNCRLSYRVISFTDLRSRPTVGVRSMTGCWG